MAGRSLRRKLWINLALTALVGALVILVVLEPGREPPPPNPPLTTIDPASVNRVVIAQGDQPTVRLERSADGWRMTEPRELRAAAGKIGDLLSVLQTGSHQSYPVSGVDIAELGLAEPRATLTLNDTRLDFGGTDAIEGRRYVRVGDSVHLVGGRHLARIRNEPLFWADSDLLPDQAEITGIELPDVSLELDDQGLWQVEPAIEGLSADAPVQLAEAWRHASALAVRAAEEPVEEDAATVRVHLAGRETPIEFRVTDLKTGFTLTREDLGLRYTMTGPQRGELLEIRPAEDDEPPAGDDTPDR